MILRRAGEYAASRVVRFKGDGGFSLRDPGESQWGEKSWQCPCRDEL